MATAVKVEDNYGAYYYIDSSSQRDVLTGTQMEANVSYIAVYCHTNYPTWTDNAIAAMCGNFRWEGILNPSQWQYGLGMSLDGGYGLGQWTPATKLLNWLSTLGIARTAISGQIDRVEWERANGEQYYKTASYPLTFTEFLTSTESPEYLASAWLYNWERPGDPGATESKRRTSAREWYDYITGGIIPPDPPDPPITTGKGLPIWMYHKNKYE